MKLRNSSLLLKSRLSKELRLRDFLRRLKLAIKDK
jgi:hypothetical protein